MDMRLVRLLCSHAPLCSGWRWLPKRDRQHGKQTFVTYSREDAYGEHCKAMAGDQARQVIAFQQKAREAVNSPVNPASEQGRQVLQQHMRIGRAAY